MKLPPVNTKIINTIPVLLSGSIAGTAIYISGHSDYFAAVILGIIAGGLVDLDNGLTGKIKNILFALVTFSVSSLAVQTTFAHPVWLAFTFTAIAFCFTMLGAAGMRFRTIAFGTLAVAVYTALTHNPHAPLYLNSLLIICGTLLYSGCTLLTHLLFPHRPVQENMAHAYDALSGSLNAKAAFFDPDELDSLPQQQVAFAMHNSSVTDAFNQCRSALFYRMRGQHRHPRTARMLHCYFVAQDIHERISSSYIDHSRFTGEMRHTDLIFRIKRLIELQAQASRQFAESLRRNRAYACPPQLERATTGVSRSLEHYAAGYSGSGVPPETVQRLTDNLLRISHQFAHLGDAGGHIAVAAHDTRTRIQLSESLAVKTALPLLKAQLSIRSPVFRHAVRMALICCICCVLVQMMAQFKLNKTDLSMGYWTLLTAVFVCQPNYSATQSKLLHRIAGTLGGVAAGSLIVLLPMSHAVQFAVAIAALTLFFFCRNNKYSYSTFFITIQAMMGFAIMGFDVSGFFVPRIIDTLLGAGVAGLAVYYLWADWKYVSLDSAGAEAIQSNAGYLQAVLHEMKTGTHDDVDYRIARRISHEKAAVLSSVLSDMSDNADKHGKRVEAGFELLKTNYSLMSYIASLGAYRAHMDGGSAEPDFAQAFFRTAESAAALLQQLAGCDADTFQAAWLDLNAQLDALQPAHHDSRVLHRQLLMIVQLLPSCYAVLHHQPQDPAPAVQAA